ncbi:sensor histidine kinase, partial [Campylobacter jejuni]|nr:sensor histidine kinase [Campylobacter jejuni]
NKSDKITLKNTQLASVISAISHELKNPLSVIDLSLEILKDEKLEDKKLKKELLEKISRQSIKFNALT